MNVAGVSPMQRVLEVVLVLGGAAFFALSPFPASLVGPAFEVLISSPPGSSLLDLDVLVGAVFVALIVFSVITAFRLGWSIPWNARKRLLWIVWGSQLVCGAILTIFVILASVSMGGLRLAVVCMLSQTPLLVCLAGQLIVLRRVYRTKVPGLCHACRYDLSGLAAGRCPECGAPIQGISQWRAANISLQASCMWFNLAGAAASGLVGPGGGNNRLFDARLVMPYPLGLRGIVHLGDAVGWMFDTPPWNPAERWFPIVFTTTLPLLASLTFGFLSIRWLGSTKAVRCACLMLVVWVPYLGWLLLEQFRSGFSFMEVAQAGPLLLAAAYLLQRLSEFSKPRQVLEPSPAPT